ncbi:hypothetical protein ACFSJY_17215 [Thalassotalea euphylliae]|uniref:hypothetical protein n=1 Tax=Thalassotalea euphylliae TaxID=1655234 RepID=UPI00364004EA
MPLTAMPLPAKVKIEISTDMLMQLINEGNLKGDECRCLDADSKQALWLSLLNSSSFSDEG